MKKSKIFIIVFALIICCVIIALFFISEKMNNSSPYFETQKNYHYFDKNRHTFASLEDIEFNKLAIIDDSQILVEVINKSDKIALVEEAFVVVNDNDKYIEKRIPFYSFDRTRPTPFIVAAQSKSIIRFYDSEVNFNNDLELSFDAKLLNKNITTQYSPYYYYLEEINATLYDTDEKITATINNTTNCALEDLTVALVFYKDSIPIQYSLNYSVMNPKPPGEAFYFDFEYPREEFDSYDFYIINVYCNEYVSTATNYLKSQIIERNSNEIIVEIENLSEYPVTIDEAYIRAKDKNGNYCDSDVLDRFFTVFGNSKAFVSINSNQFSTIDYMKYHTYFIDLDIDDYNSYIDNCIVKRKVINNEVEIEIINKTGKDLDDIYYSLVAYKDNKPVEYKSNYEYFENKQLQNGKKYKFRVPLDSNFDDAEVSILKINY